jgi:hypothetical protein
MPPSRGLAGREVLVAKFQAIEAHIAFHESRVEFLKIELDKLSHSPRQLDVDTFFDEIYRIANEAYAAGPSVSLIEGDLDRIRASSGSSYANEIQAQSLLSKDQQTELLAHCQSAEDCVSLASVVYEEFLKHVRLLEFAIAPARVLRQELIVRLSGDTSPPEDRDTFQRSGTDWRARFEGMEAILRDSKGVFHISQLLRTPGKIMSGEDLRAIELRVVGGRKTLGQKEFEDSKSGAEALSGRINYYLCYILDEEAKESYKRRLEEIAASIEEAKKNNDVRKHEMLAEENFFVTEEITSKIGLGGRDRLTLSSDRTAYNAVRNAIKRSIVSIEVKLPDLAKHLRASIQFGGSFRYEPEKPRHWET